MAKKRVTLRDVAAHAGVSTAVVSYVINNGPRPTSAAVRDRVLESVRELDYYPNSFARGLRAQRTHTVGFIAHAPNAVESFNSHYVAGILSAFTATLKQASHYMLIYPLSSDEDLMPLADLLRSGRLDGVALRRVEDVAGDDPLLALIAKSEVPCVCIERPPGAGHAFPAITYDDEAGARLATAHLLARGHRRIAHVHGNLTYASATARIAGYRAALADAGLPVDPALVRAGNWNQWLAARVTHDLMLAPDPPTAIFAASDDMALGVVEALRALGVSIPGECAVVGFDGIELGQNPLQPLTTVRVPLAEIGHAAARVLLAAMGSLPAGVGEDGGRADAAPAGGAALEQRLPVELVVGATT